MFDTGWYVLESPSMLRWSSPFTGSQSRVRRLTIEMLSLDMRPIAT